MSFRYSKKWTIPLAVCFLWACLGSESCTFDNSSTILIVSRSGQNAFALVPDSVPDLSNCTTYPVASPCCCPNYSISNTSTSEYFRCTSLTEALDQLAETEQATSVAILLGTENSFANYTLTSYQQVMNLTSLALVGMNEVVVACEIGAKLVISAVQQVYVENLVWHRCGFNNSKPLAAFTIYDSPFVTFNNTHFLDSGTSAVMVASTQVLSTANVALKFSRSTFTENGNHVHYANGGGVTIQLTTIISNEVTIEFEECHFTSNQANYGGAVYITMSTSCGNSQTVFEHCTFLYNIAKSHGGAVYSCGSSSLFQNCTFIGNSAGKVAGAVYQTSPTVTSTCQLEFQFSQCLWENNTASHSAAMYTSLSSQFLSQNSSLTQEMTNCNFTQNSLDTTAFRGETNCILEIKNIDTLVMDNVLVSNNTGSGVCSISSSLKIQGDVTIVSNVGYHGGGMYMEDSSLILSPNTSLNFVRNKAVLGGALFLKILSNNTVSQCGILFSSQSSEAAMYEVYFNDNTAATFGDAIYLTNPQVMCDLTSPEFVYEPNTENQIATGAHAIYFGDPVYNSSGHLSLNLTLGQYIVLNACIMDYSGHPSQLEALVAIAPLSNEDYWLEGINRVTLDDGMNYLNLRVKGKQITTTPVTNYSLVFISQYTVRTIQLVLNPCPAGYEYNSSNSLCICVDQDIVQCDSQSGTACIKQGYWVGEYMYENTMQPQFVTAPCTSEACVNTGEKCSECTLCMNKGLSNFCTLPSNASEQCVHGRADFICSSCSPNYSFTFGGIDCASSTTCSESSAAIIPLLDVGFLILTMLIVIFLLKIDYRMSSGYLFAFVYYFSIVSYLIPSAPGSRSLRILVSVFQSLTQLTPVFLGYIPICFAPNLTPLELQGILYINPLIVSLLIVLILTLSRYCNLPFHFKDNTPVKAICLLLLFSFTAITTTSFNIINPTYIEGLNGTFVFVQPATQYLSTKDHLPWFILASLVLVLLVLPFTLLLLVSPLLVRCINLTKIKPFLDEFQGSYKDHLRFMAAYYFICRLCYIAYLTNPATSLYYVETRYVVQLLSFALLMVHVIMQPYQNKHLNLIDTILLADIVLMTLLYGETANVVFEDMIMFRTALAYILVLVPVLIMLISSLFGLWEMFPSRCMHEWYEKHFSTRKPSSYFPNSTVVAISDEDQCSRSNSLREPLLFLLEDDEIQDLRQVHPSTVRYNRPLPNWHRGQRTSCTVVNRPHIAKRKGSSLLPKEQGDNRRIRDKSHSYSLSVSSQDWQDHNTTSDADDL